MALCAQSLSFIKLLKDNLLQVSKNRIPHLLTNQHSPGTWQPHFWWLCHFPQQTKWVLAFISHLQSCLVNQRSTGLPFWFLSPPLISIPISTVLRGEESSGWVRVCLETICTVKCAAITLFVQVTSHPVSHSPTLTWWLIGVTDNNDQHSRCLPLPQTKIILQVMSRNR